MAQPTEYLFKTLVIGDPGIGAFAVHSVARKRSFAYSHDWQANPPLLGSMSMASLNMATSLPSVVRVPLACARCWCPLTRCTISGFRPQSARHWQQRKGQAAGVPSLVRSSRCRAITHVVLGDPFIAFIAQLWDVAGTLFSPVAIHSACAMPYAG